MEYLRMLTSLVLLLSGLHFVYFTGLIFFEEIFPAIRNGTLTVVTSSTVLNRVWVGNEIYVLLTIYAAVAAGLLAAGTILARNALRGRRRLTP